MKSVKNVERVLERKSFPDFLKAMNYKVDVKEWSEVGGVLNIVMQIMKDFDPDMVFDVGCGRRPTFATLMALNYKKFVVSIDPQIGDEYCKNIQSFMKYKGKLEEFMKQPPMEFPKKALVVCNHAHVDKQVIKSFLKLFNEWVYVTVPCCYDNKLHGYKAIHVKDKHMHTDKNEIFVYSDNLQRFNVLLGGERLNYQPYKENKSEVDPKEKDEEDIYDFYNKLQEISKLLVSKKAQQVVNGTCCRHFYLTTNERNFLKYIPSLISFDWNKIIKETEEYKENENEIDILIEGKSNLIFKVASNTNIKNSQIPGIIGSLNRKRKINTFKFIDSMMINISGLMDLVDMKLKELEHELFDL